jgi:hypothetical protein
VIADLSVNLGGLRVSKPDDRCGISVASKTRSGAAEAVPLQVAIWCQHLLQNLATFARATGIAVGLAQSGFEIDAARWHLPRRQIQRTGLRTEGGKHRNALSTPTRIGE